MQSENSVNCGVSYDTMQLIDDSRVYMMLRCCGVIGGVMLCYDVVELLWIEARLCEWCFPARLHAPPLRLSTALFPGPLSSLRNAYTHHQPRRRRRRRCAHRYWQTWSLNEQPCRQSRPALHVGSMTHARIADAQWRSMQ